jgi:hypothetical protein
MYFIGVSFGFLPAAEKTVCHVAKFFYALTHRQSAEAMLANQPYRTEVGWISVHSGEGGESLRGNAGGR